MSDFGETPPGDISPEIAQQKPQIVEVKKPVKDPVSKIETGLDIKRIKEELIDLRTVSKKIDPEGRNETTQSVLEARASTRATRENIAAHKQKVQEIAELTSASYEQERQKMEELTQKLETLVVKLKNAVGIGDKQAVALQEEIDTIKSKRDVLYTQSFTIEDESKTLTEKQAKIPSPKQLLEAYYEKVSTQPLSNEQKRKLLKPEVLASLSTEEYIALWRRLNPYFLGHVTRQGFRDHNAMVYHFRGLREFHDGFLDVLRDDKLLRPPLALKGLRIRDKSSIKEFLSSWVLEAENEEEAKVRFGNLLNFSLASAPKYPDETAVHFTTQMIGNQYYGGETDNEIFFVFPSDVLASQHNFAFNGWEKDFTKPQSETMWNDVFVWSHTVDNPNIPIDAGFVFLPEKILVDPKTGSKYASEIREIDGEEKRVMIENTDLINVFQTWYKKLDNQSPINKAFVEYKKEEDYFEQESLTRVCLKVFSRELQTLGFSMDAATALGDALFTELHRRDTFTDETLQGLVRESGANWKRAENTVTAKEYWEDYFVKNPHLRPKHIHYYDGGPTTAIYEFEQANNIGEADTSNIEAKLLGFDDHHVVLKEKTKDQDPRAMVGYSELMSIGNRIISEYYQTPNGK